MFARIMSKRVQSAVQLMSNKSQKLSRFIRKHPAQLLVFSNKFNSLNFLSLSFTVYAIAPKVNKDETKDNWKTFITQSDELFTMGKFEESCSVLELLKESKNEEVLWRLSRGLYNMSKVEKDKKLKEKYLREAHSYIIEAMELNENHFAVHKWMAILVDAVSQLEGTKARILSLEKFKFHLSKSMELNPKDATSIYMLGHYCYTIAEMPWYQRQIASAVFAAPPVSSFEEALFYFKKAEEVEPNFYSLNLLLLGKTYMKLNQTDSAKYWLTCAANYPVRTEEDQEVRQEAYELLRKFSK